MGAISRAKAQLHRFSWGRSTMFNKTSMLSMTEILTKSPLGRVRLTEKRPEKRPGKFSGFLKPDWVRAVRFLCFLPVQGLSDPVVLGLSDPVVFRGKWAGRSSAPDSSRTGRLGGLYHSDPVQLTISLFFCIPSKIQVHANRYFGRRWLASR